MLINLFNVNVTNKNREKKLSFLEGKKLDWKDKMQNMLILLYEVLVYFVQKRGYMTATESQLFYEIMKHNFNSYFYVIYQCMEQEQLLGLLRALQLAKVVYLLTYALIYLEH